VPCFYQSARSAVSIPTMSIEELLNIINGLIDGESLEISAKNGTVEVAFRKILARLGKG